MKNIGESRERERNGYKGKEKKVQKKKRGVGINYGIKNNYIIQYMYNIIQMRNLVMIWMST